MYTLARGSLPLFDGASSRRTPMPSFCVGDDWAAESADPDASNANALIRAATDAIRRATKLVQ